MRETAKSNIRRKDNALFQKVFSGRGIDIGAGADPLAPCDSFPNIESVKDFDVHVGNAQFILNYEEPRSYDFVYSSHCLEHLLDPYQALELWGALVKPGGYLVLAVPDEDLYEQGVWPSQFNLEHKFTFSLDKFKSWSPVSINVKDMISYCLPSVSWETLALGRVMTNYDVQKIGFGIDQTSGDAEANIEAVLRKLP